MSAIKKKLQFPSAPSFEFTIEYVNIPYFSERDEFPLHIHNTLEIYLNLSGKVSFMVENQTYPISRGSVIITKPFEYHHCIYHNHLQHEHYCIRISNCEELELLSQFINREKGKHNHIGLTEEQTLSLKKHLDILISMEKRSYIDQYYHFIRVLQIIGNNSATMESDYADNIPQNLKKVLNIISTQYASRLTVASLAAEIFVSVGTLERQFKKYLNTSPTEYIKRKRLAEAMRLLIQGISVSQVAYQCGFPDASNFIKVFKKNFGHPPYQYMKLMK
ncbi:MAG: AraC family transcriptional regulator [Clostridia bacterium]|nr:AraC family transcriptional regulator [Clostridia bacterium]